MSESVSTNRHAFKSSFGHLPLEVGDWVMMRLLNMGQGNWFLSLALIPNPNYTVGTSTADDVSELVVVSDVGDGRGRVEGNLRSVGVL